MSASVEEVPARAVPAPYVPADAARFWPEEGKNPRRSPFQRDRARVLHSSGLRRLGAKTQVLGPSSDDFVRTRLTHSLEVAQVGRELGQALGCDPDVVDAACLSHDLGHPPFGHNGERALHEVAAGIGGFEGNAQTLRLLTSLEPKIMTDDGTGVGLNLTRATLDAATKYPWAAGEGPRRADGSTTAKFGVYADDAAAFAWLRDGAPTHRRCLEAQVMDLADDVAYSVHDVEDAVAGGRVDLATVRSEAALTGVVAQVRAWYDPDLPDDEIGAALERVLALPVVPREFDHSWAGLAALKDMASQLIGRFCAAAEDATREQYGPDPLARYAADLVVPAATTAEILALKGVAAHFVMAPRETEPLYLAQRTIIFDLADALSASGDAHLEPHLAERWRGVGSEEERMRVVVDQIASLTDTSAQQWHARLCGMLSEVY
ncbi:MAG: deoxyguanosinetriphosphate triphosphohydrolase [Actinomycetaceae bacterium]